jgi:Fe2+ or Zn2+ uptake regulation protein
VEKLLQKHKLKVTPAREAILKLFSYDCKPLSAEDIAQRFTNKQINLVTVYRTLATFEKAGILKQVDLRKDAISYELTNHHHHHIVCVRCGIMETFELCGIGKISKDVLKHSKQFKEVKEHSLELFGVCRTCTKR